MKYKVQITETLQRVESVSASSSEEALNIVRIRYRKSDIVLSDSDFVECTEFVILDSSI